jgi:DNA-binding SARP family transcriptional activator
VEAGVAAIVGGTVESNRFRRAGLEPAIQVRLLGPVTVRRGGDAVPLPASRKVRALLAYLALSPQPVTRRRLCELLWDVPSDPRGELRWCLSKLRRVLDEPRRRRVLSSAESVRLDLSDCFVDVLEIAGATQKGVEALDAERLRTLVALFGGEFLDGLEIDRNPDFNSWLTAERRRFRSRHVATLEQLAQSVQDDESLAHLEKWLELAPFDLRAHEILLRKLAEKGGVAEGERHLAATARAFEAEGLDHAPIRRLWAAARAGAREASIVRVASSAEAAVTAGSPAADASPRRASIAVMPFIEQTDDRGGYADGLVHDVITRLAKLRSLFVIAQGTVFALRDRRVGPEEAGRTLNVDYVATGTVRGHGKGRSVAIELTETRTARIVWSEVFDNRADDAFAVLDEVGNRIVASIASEIEAVERNRAMLRPPASLDAWEAHHRGLWHMYRFNKADNERARHFFEMAVRLDPTFARAFAGLSFTHWQNAFQGWASREGEIERAYATAGQSLMADDRDPAAHWAMGRALWLRGLQDQSVAELERSVDLSPNFAMGHYSLAFVSSQAGDAQAAIAASDHSRHLSPYDPMLFAMLASRAMALVRQGNFEEGAEWAIRAAARPNAHAHIMGVAAYSLALAGRVQEARSYIGKLHATAPAYGIEDFLGGFRFDAHGEALFRKGAELLIPTRA